MQHDCTKPPDGLACGTITAASNVCLEEAYRPSSSTKGFRIVNANELRRRGAAAVALGMCLVVSSCGAPSAGNSLNSASPASVGEPTTTTILPPDLSDEPPVDPSYQVSAEAIFEQAGATTASEKLAALLQSGVVREFDGEPPLPSELASQATVVVVGSLLDASEGELSDPDEAAEWQVSETDVVRFSVEVSEVLVGDPNRVSNGQMAVDVERSPAIGWQLIAENLPSTQVVMFLVEREDGRYFPLLRGGFLVENDDGDLEPMQEELLLEDASGTEIETVEELRVAIT